MVTITIKATTTPDKHPWSSPPTYVDKAAPPVSLVDLVDASLTSQACAALLRGIANELSPPPDRPFVNVTNDE